MGPPVRVRDCFGGGSTQCRLGLLKISASAGFPEYVDSYLFAEQVALWKRAVETSQVANAAAFLLSLRFSRYQCSADCAGRLDEHELFGS